MVSRKSDNVENIEGASNLFEIEETFSIQEYDIYIYSTLEKEVLECTVREMLRFGIGAQRSVGKGIFDISSKLEVFNGFKLPEKPNGFIALSNFIPHKEDPIKGYYKTFVKYPKISYISSEEDSPFKKPLIFLKAGSVFFNESIKKFYGSCIQNIGLEDDRISDKIVIGAHTIAIPCNINY